MLKHLLLRSDATFNPHHMEVVLALMLSARWDRHLSGNRQLLQYPLDREKRGTVPRTKRC